MVPYFCDWLYYIKKIFQFLNIEMGNILQFIQYIQFGLELHRKHYAHFRFFLFCLEIFMPK